MINVEGGFFEIFIFLDCVHYHRKVYLVISQGQFIDKNNHKLIILKAIVVQIWFQYNMQCFELLRSNNELNILNRFPLLLICCKVQAFIWFVRLMAIGTLNIIFSTIFILDGQNLCKPSMNPKVKMMAFC